MPNNGKTMRNLRLKPGAALMKATLNARRPRVVQASNFFPGPTSRPTITPPRSFTPTQVSTESLFPEKKPSAFNLDPATLRLRNRQEKAVKAAEGKNVLAFPMDYSSGGPAGGRRTRKRRNRRSHKHRGGSCRKI